MSIFVVLNRSQNIINLALVIRSMKNFCLKDLRLVNPAEFDPYRIEGIAHGTADVVERVKLFDTFEEAVADCHLVVGLTARHRTARHSVRRAREAVKEIVGRAESENVAIVLGPEDNGLTNLELDRCDRAVTIDTGDEHTSLNLAHAFTIMAYELFVARNEPREFKAPRRVEDPATHDDLEFLFADVEKSLDTIEFFKSRKPRAIMRTVRELVRRGSLDHRESRLMRGMALELRHFLVRKGLLDESTFK